MTPQIKSRLGVVEHVYHQASNDQAFQVEGRYSRPLVTNEQPYRRKLTLTKEWQPFDSGWVKEAGMIHVSNEEGKHAQVIPTEREAAVTSAKVIELASFDADPNPYLIMPGETFRGQPKDVRQLMIRCQYGTATCWVTVFPR
jgi:hypothetical protein